MELPASFFWLIVVWLVVIGGAVGSFLNVIVYRLPLGISIVYPPSRCPKCGKGIAWYDNVPVFGWIILRGRCRQCRNPISGRYPLIEGITALMFGAVAAVELPQMSTAACYAVYPYNLLLLCTLLCASLIEFDGNRVPWRLFVPALLAGFIAPLFLPQLRPMSGWHELFCEKCVPLWLGGLVDGAIGLGVGLLLGFLAERSFHRGDRSIGLLLGPACVGLYLGWESVSYIFLGTLVLMGAAWLVKKAIPRLRLPVSMIFGVVTLAWILCDGALHCIE